MNINFENIEKDILKQIIYLLIVPVSLIILYYYISRNLPICLSLLAVYMFSLYKYVKNRFINKPDNNTKEQPVSKREFGTMVYQKVDNKEIIDSSENVVENPEKNNDSENIIIEEFTSNVDATQKDESINESM